LLIEEFMEPVGMTQMELGEKTGLPMKVIDELCRDQRAVTLDTARILATAFGNSAEFWLNAQRRMELWDAGTNLSTARAKS
jgi:addiction module HigA family antidote